MNQCNMSVNNFACKMSNFKGKIVVDILMYVTANCQANLAGGYFVAIIAHAAHGFRREDRSGAL